MKSFDEQDYLHKSIKLKQNQIIKVIGSYFDSCSMRPLVKNVRSKWIVTLYLKSNTAVILIVVDDPHGKAICCSFILKILP